MPSERNNKLGRSSVPVNSFFTASGNANVSAGAGLLVLMVTSMEESIGIYLLFMPTSFNAPVEQQGRDGWRCHNTIDHTGNNPIKGSIDHTL